MGALSQYSIVPRKSSLIDLIDYDTATALPVKKEGEKLGQGLFLIYRMVLLFRNTK